jgi:3-oxoacyl-[acyl-carrier protein] reductase
MRAGVSGLAKTLSQAVAGENIRVNVVAPGYFDTGRVRRRVDAIAADEGVARAEAVKRVAAAAPMGRLGVAAELAELVAFVVSRRAAYLTGATIVIDGGAGRGVF